MEFYNYTTYEFMGNLDFDIKFTDYLYLLVCKQLQYENYFYTTYVDLMLVRRSVGEHGRITDYSSNMYRVYANQLLRF